MQAIKEIAKECSLEAVERAEPITCEICGKFPTTKLNKLYDLELDDGLFTIICGSCKIKLANELQEIIDDLQHERACINEVRQTGQPTLSYLNSIG